MPKIVISYRRSDSDAIAGRIRDRLANHYGEDAIFMDIDSIPLGIDFRKHVKGALSQSNVVIAVIGPKWLGPRHRGRPRIQEDTDPVRIEIETALASGLRLIPVLVNHATMPKPSDLPQSLEQFAYHNAAEIDAGRDFHQHMDRLIRQMDEILGVQIAAPSPPSARAMPVQRTKLLLAAAVGACVVGAVAVAWLLRDQLGRFLEAPQRAEGKPRAPAAEGKPRAAADGRCGRPGSFGAIGVLWRQLHNGQTRRHRKGGRDLGPGGILRQGAAGALPLSGQSAGSRRSGPRLCQVVARALRLRRGQGSRHEGSIRPAQSGRQLCAASVPGRGRCDPFDTGAGRGSRGLRLS
jgi:uncharacterized low-complexity protein